MNRLITQLRAQRQSWVDLAPGKRVQIIRPAETELVELLVSEDGARHVRVGPSQMRKYVVGWDGFTEADLLGASVGASDAILFDADLWVEVVIDRNDWMEIVGTALLNSITKHFEQKAAAEKN